jgi:hypothetical protein
MSGKLPRTFDRHKQMPEEFVGSYPNARFDGRIQGPKTEFRDWPLKTVIVG